MPDLAAFGNEPIDKAHMYYELSYSRYVPEMKAVGAQCNVFRIASESMKYEVKFMVLSVLLELLVVSKDLGDVR
jgi:hypothetical protein